MEFVKAWYHGLSLAQLATFRLEAQEELAVVEDDLVKRAASIAEYTDTSIFVPERVENGAEAPPEWFGLNPEDGEDSAEVIDSGDGLTDGLRRRSAGSTMRIGGHLIAQVSSNSI